MHRVGVFRPVLRNNKKTKTQVLNVRSKVVIAPLLIGAFVPRANHSFSIAVTINFLIHLYPNLISSHFFIPNILQTNPTQHTCGAKRGENRK